MIANDQSWTQVDFPTSGLQQEFLDQVRLWNRVEGLPRIRTEPIDPCRLRIDSAADGQNRVLQLIAAYGGRVTAS